MPGIIGKNTISLFPGPSVGQSHVNQAVIWRYTAVANDVVTDVNVYGVTSVDANAQLAIYLWTGGAVGARVHTPIAVPNNISPAQWISAPANVPLVAGLEYVIAFSSENLTTVFRITETWGDSEMTVIYPLPDPWQAGALTSFQRSYYATVGTAAPPTTKIFYPCRAQLIE